VLYVLICAGAPADTTDEPYNEERITPCLHSFCRGCIEDVLNSALRDAVDFNEQEAGRALHQNMRPCPICRAELDPAKVFTAAAFEPPVIDDDEDDDEGKGGNESQAEEASDDEVDGGLSLKAKGKRKMVSMVENRADCGRRRMMTKISSLESSARPEPRRSAWTISWMNLRRRPRSHPGENTIMV
jgi:hypothetical protein